MEDEPWVTERATEIEIRCVLQPRAAQTEIVGIQGEEIKIRLQAPPVDGKANDALSRLLAKEFGVGHKAVQIVSGLSSRHKRVRIQGRRSDDLQAILCKADRCPDKPAPAKDV